MSKVMESITRKTSDQTDPSPESHEIYEDVDGEGNVRSEELYIDMEHSEKSSTISVCVQHGADEEFYMHMGHEGDAATEELYTDMEGAGESPSDLYISMEQGLFCFHLPYIIYLVKCYHWHLKTTRCMSFS